LLSLSPFATPTAEAADRVILFGGGSNPPEEATRLLVDWASTPRLNVLVITWATEEPDKYTATLASRLAPHVPKTQDLASTLVAAPSAAEMATDRGREEFLRLLENASAVFLSGGDQNRFMKTLLMNVSPQNRISMATIRNRILERYHNGLVIVGTSAGAAAASSRMITGDQAVPVSEGLGLVDYATIDTHFFKRMRQQRLATLMERNPAIPFGLGIDEDGAVSIVDGQLRVLGEKGVLLIDRNTARNGRILYPGESRRLQPR
jgi:cyanophycinase